MATMPERDPIKRVAVLVELESGATLAVYAQPDPQDNDAEVVFNTDRRTPAPDPDLPPVWPAYQPGVLWADIHVKGLHQLEYLIDKPATIGAGLDLIQSMAKP